MRPLTPPTAQPEVVAGLVNDDRAFAVAEEAVALAAELGTRVRFVHVETAPFDADDESDGIIFRAATHALVRHDVPATFEVVPGHPVAVLLERSRTARALVVGSDRPCLPEDAVPPGTARLCLHDAACEVRVVAPSPRRLSLSAG